jgi:hypothetical protein
MSQEKLNEEVESKKNQQTEEEILSYWTPEREREAQPIPLPTVEPPAEGETGNSEDEFSKAEEVVVEPVGPEN